VTGPSGKVNNDIKVDLQKNNDGTFLVNCIDTITIPLSSFPLSFNTTR
jgi:hypothetical protein